MDNVLVADVAHNQCGILVSGDIWELELAMIFNIALLIIKYKLKTDFLGRISLAVTIAAVLHIVPAGILGLSLGIDYGMDVSNIVAGSIESAVYGLTFGALIANIVSVALLLGEALTKASE